MEMIIRLSVATASFLIIATLAVRSEADEHENRKRRSLESSEENLEDLAGDSDSKRSADNAPSSEFLKSKSKNFKNYLSRNEQKENKRIPQKTKRHHHHHRPPQMLKTY